MDISEILRTKYSDKEWVLEGRDYEALVWRDSSAPKPTEQELSEIWDSEEFTIEASNDKTMSLRRKEIMTEWPYYRQFEALTEASLGRPEKLEELKNFIISTKEEYPKS